MKALVLDVGGLHVRNIPAPVCPADHVRVRLHAAALNHRDQYIRDGQYSNIVLPAVLGSDGVGVVTEAPSYPALIGQRVVIDPSLNWGDNPHAQGKLFSVLGMPSQGTFAEEIVVAQAYVHQAPKHLSDEQAAALPLAGVTAFRALFTQGALQPDNTVLITGIGGGVASMAMIFALAAGARVVVTSTSDEKIARATTLGATAGVNVHEEDWAKKITSHGPIDLIIDSVGGDTLNNLTNILTPGGRLVLYGSSRGPVPSMNLHRIFWKQLSVVGSTMGTQSDFSNMLAFVDLHGVVPIVDSTFTFESIEQAFDRLQASEQFGKIVIQCN